MNLESICQLKQRKSNFEKVTGTSGLTHRSTSVRSIVQIPTVRRIIGAASETARGATLIAQEAGSPIASSSVLGITAAVANVLANIASERKGVFLVVAKGIMV